MKNLFLFSLISIFLFCNCSPDEVDNNKLPESIEWLYSIEELNTGLWVSMEDPIIYNDVVIIPRVKWDDSKAELIALNKNDGKLLWTWSEAFDKYNFNGFSFRSHTYDGILTIGQNNYTAGIDINTGLTVWEDLGTMLSRSSQNGVRETIFKTDFISNEKYFLKKGNIYSGDWETIYEFEKEEGYKLGSNNTLAIEWEGKTYVAFLKGNWGHAELPEQYFLYLYNVTDDHLEWISDSIPVDFANSGTPGVTPTFDDGQIMLSNDAIYSYNLKDGRLKWKNYYGNTFTFTSRILAHNGKVYGNNGDEYFICLDVHTGEEIFRTITGGSPSRVQVNNGKCFLSGVTTNEGNRFMVIDANNGQILHNLQSPYVDIDNEAALAWVLTVDKETGLAYTSDRRNLLCYNFE